MIQSELRLGNWVCYRDKRNLQVSNLGDFFQTVNSLTLQDGSDDISDYTPIPLTPEILVKAGFVKANTTDNYIIFINGIAFGISANGDVDMDYMEFEEVCNIKYLHTLQNLYFALTGEELTFEL